MGDMRMDEVSVATIQQFYDWMATAGERGRKKNLNAKSIERIAGLTGRIFKVAVEMKIIEESPFKHSLLRIHAEQAGHHKAMADAQIAHVRCAIPALKNPDERLYMGLLAYTGMRPEEVLGLRWEDVALDAQYATLVRAVTYPGNSKPHVGKPKTSYSARTVVLPGILVDLLRPLQKTSGFILGGEQPWCYSRKHRVSKAAFAHLGLKGYSDADFPHDVRHADEGNGQDLRRGGRYDGPRGYAHGRASLCQNAARGRDEAPERGRRNQRQKGRCVTDV